MDTKFVDENQNLKAFMEIMPIHQVRYKCLEMSMLQIRWGFDQVELMKSYYMELSQLVPSQGSLSLLQAAAVGA